MFRVLPLAVLLLAAIGSDCAAQTIDDIRDALREDLRDVQFAKSFAGLIALSDEFELSSARLRFDDAVDTELSTISFPFQKVFRPLGEDAPGLYAEGVIGYARAKQYADDFYQGGLPGVETAVGARWTTYGAFLGAGPQFRLAEGLALAGILNGGLARIESTADYAGPGAALTAAIADGIAFNWDAYTWSAGGAARIDWTRPLGKRHAFELVARYDLRWFGVFGADDDAQEFTTRAQIATLRGDLVGPTGLTLDGAALSWRVTAGYRRFLESDFFDLKALFQIGGALELEVGDTLSVGGRVSLSAAAFLGEHVTGWSVGLGFSF